MTNDALKLERILEIANTHSNFLYEGSHVFSDRRLKLFCADVINEYKAALAKTVDVAEELRVIVSEIQQYTNSFYDIGIGDEINDIVERLDHLAAQGLVGVPEGYAIVPIKYPITNKMKADCIAEFSFKIDVPEIIETKKGWVFTGKLVEREVIVPWDLCKKIYKAMIKAAPKKDGEE